MIEHIKLKFYKGIESVSLHSLGQINVICGKNNSGKSSILEAMVDKNHFGLGKKVDESIKTLFKPLSLNYSDPVPSESMRWFDALISELSANDEIWFNSDISEIINFIKDNMRLDRYLAKYNRDIFEFDNILSIFFESIVNEYKPFLIPPKRSISFDKGIITSEEITPSGEGIVNKLFFLKNQDIKTKDYKTYLSIYEEFEFITGRNFSIIPKMGNQIELYFNNEKNDWIPAKNCGLGLSDVLIILGQVNLTNYSTYLIEEPENHLHAEYQKRLLSFFKRQVTKQFVLSTHSNIFLDPNIVDKIIYTDFLDNVKVSDVTSRSIIISSLGYSVTDNLASDLIILTEGTTDIPIIKTILNWKGLDLIYNVKFWPLGGDMMNNLDLDVFSQYHSVIALLDSDFQSKDVRDEFKMNCKKLNIECFQLERYAIENYLSLEAIKSIYLNLIPSDFVKLDSQKSVKSQLGFNIKSKNYQTIKMMSLDDFDGTDLLRFCDRIETILKNIT